MATIEKRGPYQWRARVRKRGYPTETRTFETKAQAETWARKIESEMDYGVFVSRAEAERTTFGELIGRYRDEVSSTKKGRDVETIRLNAMLKHPLFSRILSGISSYDIAAYRDERLQQVSSSTVLKEITLLGQAIDIGIKEWGLYLPANPVRNIRRPSPAKARERRLMPGEEERLISAVDKGSRNQWLKPIVCFALESGMRRGELLGLAWTHVNLGLRTARLPETKNGDSRSVPLSSSAIQILKSIPRSIEGNVFSLSVESLKQAFKRSVDRAGIDNFKVSRFTP